MYQAILARNKFMIFRKCLYLVSLRFNIAILTSLDKGTQPFVVCDG